MTSSSSSLADFNAHLATRAKLVIFDLFPQRILHLQSLIDGFEDASSPFNPGHPQFVCSTTIQSVAEDILTDSSGVTTRETLSNGIAPPPPVDGSKSASTSAALKSSLATADTSGEVDDDRPLLTGLPTNPIYSLIGRVLEREGAHVLSSCSDVRRWLATVTPKIEEGNNTGVEIQELALGMLNSLQNLGSDCSNYLYTARQNRASGVRLYLRAPGIEDRRLSLEDGDRIEVFGA